MLGDAVHAISADRQRVDINLHHAAAGVAGCNRASGRVHPIVVYCGENIASEPSDNFGENNWRARLAMALLWVAAINRHGGDATLVHLPEIGICDLNYIRIADLMSEFLERKVAAGR